MSWATVDFYNIFLSFYKNNSYLYREVIMNIRTMVLSMLYALGLPGSPAHTHASGGEYTLLDDFSGEVSRIGTVWEGFTGQVMGGVSEMTVSRVPDPEGAYLRMQGKVSLKNNGGFVQVRLKLSGDGKPFDGSVYEGIRLVVRGEGTGYYIFIRTTGTLFPWKFYKAAVPITTEWATVELPWSSFGPGDYGRMRSMDVRKLRSLALTAYGREFDARIDLKETGLY